MSADEQTGADATEGAAEAGKMFTQEQVNDFVAKRVAKMTREAEAREAELQAKVSQYEQAAMTEQERIAKAAADAEARAQAAEARLRDAEAGRVRAELIAEKAADLPPVFRRLITGNTAEEIDESINAARTEYENLKTALGGSVTRSVGSGISGTAPPAPTAPGAADSRGMSPYEKLMAASSDGT